MGILFNRNILLILCTSCLQLYQKIKSDDAKECGGVF